MPSAAGDGLRVEALMRDVSERKRLQDQSRDLYHQLLQAEKLAALGQTMSGVAHELNNPLATILACAERLSQRPGRRADPHGPRHHPQRRRTRRPHRPQPADVRAQAPHDAHDGRSQPGRARDAGAARLRTAGRERHDLEALAAGLPPAFADPHQIQQILLNLIINAEQAMLAAHGRGTLILRTWHDPDRDAVVLEVNDDGPGVPEDVQPSIFDPFFTTKEVGKGTGLGLTVAYAIAQEHGGRITVASAAERGASFCLELPVGAGSLKLPVPRPVETSTEACRRRRGAGRRGRSGARRGRRGVAAGRRVSPSIARATAKKRSSACASGTTT